jgi:carbamoyl-phosphate synthase large subunit
MADPNKILVTSAGTGSATNVIHALKSQKDVSLEVWACDADPSAPGLFLADHGLIAPSAAKPDEYLAFFFNLAKIKGPFSLIPTLSREIALISSWGAELLNHGITTLLPSERTVRLCDDKALFSSFCASENIPSPRVVTAGDLPYPVFIKPRIGSGSKGSGPARNRTESDALLAQAYQPLIQEFIEGPEITVDVLCRRGGTPLVISARQRVSVKNGQSVKGTTVSSEPYAATISKACGRLEMTGPCNFQFILCPHRGPVLIEINPRFAAGGLALSVHAGANIPLLAVKLMLDLPITPTECVARTGVHMSKYWSEVFWESPR